MARFRAFQPEAGARFTRRRKRKWPPCGGHDGVGVLSSAFVVTMPDDHHPVAVVTMHALVRAVIAVLAEFGAGAAVIAMPDHHGLGAGDRRCCDGDRGKGGNDVTKLLHDVLLG